jgi:hypothetical protein
VFLRLHCMIRLSLAAILGLAVSILCAQAPAAPPAIQASGAPAQAATPAATVTIRGHITDQTGALIPGANVTILDASGNTVRSLTADASGAYEARGLPAGS